MSGDKKFEIIKEKIKNISKPLILELGVNKGHSSKKFLQFQKEYCGFLYSIDIKDCSNVINDQNWNFYKCNDLNYKSILNKFPKIKSNGIDLLFIDSYHDPNHVKKLLLNWWPYLNKNSLIYFDDTESYIYRKKKNYILSIINDSVSNIIKEYYYSNYNQINYTKYFMGSGLSEFLKLSEKGTAPCQKEIWNYNPIFSLFYLRLKKFIFFLKNLKFL